MINLSYYDFKQVLAWVCEQFPSDDQLREDDSEKSYIIHGYKINNWLADQAIRSDRCCEGLRNLTNTMTPVLGNKTMVIPSLGGNVALNLQALALELKPYLAELK